MKRRERWTDYLWLSLLAFGAFFLEYAVIFLVDGLLLRVNLGNYTPLQRGFHCMFMACLWAVIAGALLLFSRRRLGFPARAGGADAIPPTGWVWAFACLAGCKILTFLDWHTLKVVGEFREKTLFEFGAQYLYYLAEVILVLLILIYGQKAGEAMLYKACAFPFGGVILALTWGAFHFVSRGAGLELWNGISTMLFSLLAGLIYVKLNRKLLLSYLFLTVGYLL